jgi:exodeoxyribonuclease VIII
VSKSSLWHFRENGADAYYHKYIAKDAPPEKASSAMDLGTLVHAALLEPEKLATDFAVWPDNVLSIDGKATTKAAKEFQANNAGKVILKADEWHSASVMAANVRALVGEWFKAKPVLETSLFWTNEATEVDCRCRCDFLANLSDRVIVADLKTCRNAAPHAFTKAVESYGYWMQDALYTDGVEAVYGKPARFVFIAVQSTFPFTVAVYELSEEDKEAARYHTLASLGELAGRMERNDWSEPWINAHSTISLSRFAFE